MVVKRLTVELPGEPNIWLGNDTRIEPISVWGNGNRGRDHWGWPNMAKMDVSEITINSDNRAAFEVYLEYDQSVSDSSEFAVTCRISKNAGLTNHVFCQYFRD